MKTCSRCQRRLSKANFHKHRNRPDGIQAHCKKCTNDLTLAHYYKNRERYLLNGQKRTAMLRKDIDKLKDFPCKDCGKKYPPYVMDFDHMEGFEKVAGINELWRKRKKLSLIIEEAKKCELVCANCHRERSHQRIIKNRLHHMPSK